MRGDRERAAEMCLKRIDTTDVIRMQMRDDDLAHLPAFGDHFVEHSASACCSSSYGEPGSKTSISLEL
jgi:hypothetical protein